MTKAHEPSSKEFNPLEAVTHHWGLLRTNFHELNQEFPDSRKLAAFITKDATDHGTTLGDYQKGLVESLANEPGDTKRTALLGVVCNYMAAGDFSTPIRKTILWRSGQHYDYDQAQAVRSGLVSGLRAADKIVESLGLMPASEDSPFHVFQALETQQV